MPLAVLIGDLDEFKRVNDRHGHHVGDAVLRETASTLRATLRTFDYIYRYGGEEFVILLPGTDEARALATAERVRDAIAAAHPAGLRDDAVARRERRRRMRERFRRSADRGRSRALSGEGRRAQPRMPRPRLRRRQPGNARGLAGGERGARASAERSASGSTPAEAFELARRTFIEGEPLDMQALAGRLADLAPRRSRNGAAIASRCSARSTRRWRSTCCRARS